MDKLIEKLLRLDELFVFLAPGLLLELSLLIWFPVDGSALGALLDHTILLAALALIVAVAIGLIMFPIPRRGQPPPGQYAAEQRRRLGQPDDDGSRRLFHEAEAAHLRFQLSRGLGFSFGLLVVQIVLRFVLDVLAARLCVLQSIVKELPDIPILGLGILAFVGGFMAVALRKRAHLESSLERELTSRAYRGRDKYS